MAGEKLYSGSNMNALLQNKSFPCSSESLASLWCPNSSSTYHGSKSVVNFGNVSEPSNADGPFFQPIAKEDNCDEDYDACLQQPGKKRRLTAVQVQFLEKNFEIENKLEPERKVQLAKELDLEPRQVAIWFQNRRARFKTKQLEKDYDGLKASYDKLRVDYDNLLKENEKLKNEVQALEDKCLLGVSREENQEPLNHEVKVTNPINSKCQNAILNAVPKVESSNVPVKQEEATSAKSDVFDSDSPDGNHSTFLEHAESSNVYEREHSDFSQNDDDDSFNRSLLTPPCCPKLEDESCNLGFPVEDQLFCFWP